MQSLGLRQGLLASGLHADNDHVVVPLQELGRNPSKRFVVIHQQDADPLPLLVAVCLILHRLPLLPWLRL